MSKSSSGSVGFYPLVVGLGIGPDMDPPHHSPRYCNCSRYLVRYLGDEKVT